ncbi:hypothetical protein O1M54_43255 [Streptomyces diastatochromogenes]|nr:hypothetical protein [Streptomyces diastatochromogenes]
MRIRGRREPPYGDDRTVPSSLTSVTTSDEVTVRVAGSGAGSNRSGGGADAGSGSFSSS